MQLHFNRFHGAHIVIADNNAREIKVYYKNDDDRDVPVVATVGRACGFIFILLFSAFLYAPKINCRSSRPLSTSSHGPQQSQGARNTNSYALAVRIAVHYNNIHVLFITRDILFFQFSV